MADGNIQSGGDFHDSDISVLDALHDVPAADATTNAQIRDVIGNKADTAETTVGVVASIVAYVKGILNRIGTPAGASVSADIAVIKGLVDSVENSGAASHANNTNEQFILSETSTLRRKVAFDFTLRNMTQDGTIRLKRKVDGSNLDLWDEKAFVASSDIKVFDFEFTTNQDWEVTYQSTVAEGASRNIPFNHIEQEFE